LHPSFVAQNRGRVKDEPLFGDDAVSSN
jgi:hypothetical protein